MNIDILHTIASGDHSDNANEQFLAQAILELIKHDAETNERVDNLVNTVLRHDAQIDAAADSIGQAFQHSTELAEIIGSLAKGIQALQELVKLNRLL